MAVEKGLLRKKPSRYRLVTSGIALSYLIVDAVIALSHCSLKNGPLQIIQMLNS
jgi:hypothetical protein